MVILLIVLMLLLSAFFSGTEIAFVASNRLKVEARARQSGRTGMIVHTFLKNPSSVLTTTLVGNNISLVIYAALMEIVLSGPLHRFCESIGLGAGVDVAVLVTQTIIASVIVLFIGEIFPKSIMQGVADRIIFWLAWPLKGFQTLLTYLPPFFIPVAGSAAAVLVRFLGNETQTAAEFLRRDLEVLIQESKVTGELDLDEEERTLLSNVFMLSTVRVRESMVPRTDIKAVEDTDSLDRVREVFQTSGFSKLPVYHENIDNIVGVVFAYDLFKHPETLTQMIRRVRFVPETKHSKDLLRELLAESSSIAIVIDEYGGTAGLVTVEDLIEELTGDIQDEFDADEFLIRSIDENTFVVSGRAEIDELAEKSDVVLPAGDYETVAGFLLEHMGYIPKVNDDWTEAGFRFVILKATKNKIDLIKVIRIDS